MHALHCQWNRQLGPGTSCSSRAQWRSHASTAAGFGCHLDTTMSTQRLQRRGQRLSAGSVCSPPPGPWNRTSPQPVTAMRRSHIHPLFFSRAAPHRCRYRCPWRMDDKRRQAAAGEGKKVQCARGECRLFDLLRLRTNGTNAPTTH